MLLEDMAAPLPILQTLWNVNGAEARRSSRDFVFRSLAQRDGAAESIRLHDLQLDYVRAQYPREDKQALDLIHGALRLSEHVIGEDAEQFSSQMVGRLLTYRDMPAIERFTQRAAEGTGRQWLRPPQPALHPPGTALVRILTGHAGGASAVAVTPDGQRAVSASDNKTVKLWNLETGEVLVIFTCDSAANCCAFSDALTLIVAGDAGGHLHFLRLEEPKTKD